MKICPTCQASFPDGFQYCPNDTDVLLTSEAYAQRLQNSGRAPAVEALSLTGQGQSHSVEAEGLGAASKLPKARPLRQAEAQHEVAAERRPERKTEVTPIATLSSARAVAASNLNFSLPDQGSFFTRLIDNIRLFIRDFGKGAPRLRPGERDELHLLLNEEPFLGRLKREVTIAAAEFRQDPRRFIAEMLRGEGSSRRRRQLLQAGLALGVIVYAFLFTTFLISGLIRFGMSEEKKPEAEKLVELARLTAVPSEIDKTVVAKGKEDFAGGSKPKPQKASGGGGGGRQEPTPPSKGNLPQASLTQQILPPNPAPPKIQNPSLPVPMTVYADPKALPEFKGGPIGLPTGVDGPPSSGPGIGAGIGRGSGTGVGPGEGGGVGPGRGGNVGGGDFGLGGGGGIEEAGKNGVGKPIILYKEKAKYTEEARQNKVQGTVLLSAVFTKDGRITDIRVIRGLPDGLTEKAIEAAQKIRFKPATKNGVPVNVRANLEFNFALY
jgi:TonB family protein